jgi:hypothetical protein
VAHKLHGFDDLNIQVCSPLLLEQELTAEVRYPKHISSATAVPAWAYLDVVTPDNFDPVSALRAVSLPESTVGNNEVSTSYSSTSSLTSSSGTSMPTPLLSNNTSSETAAIIGGTIGGILGLCLIAILLLYLKRYASKRNESGTGLRHSRSDRGHGGPSQPPAMLQLEYLDSSPWSPPPPGSMPLGAVSPTSAQSLLLTHGYGDGGREGGSADYYHGSPSWSRTSGQVDLLGHSGSRSIGFVSFHTTHKRTITT